MQPAARGRQGYSGTHRVARHLGLYHPRCRRDRWNKGRGRDRWSNRTKTRIGACLEQVTGQSAHADTRRTGNQPTARGDGSQICRTQRGGVITDDQQWRTTNSAGIHTRGQNNHASPKTMARKPAGGGNDHAGSATMPGTPHTYELGQISSHTITAIYFLPIAVFFLTDNFGIQTYVCNQVTLHVP